MIVLNKIAKHFASKEVLKEITLSIADGEILGLIGKNGAGKTTLLNILAGLSTATSATRKLVTCLMFLHFMSISA